MDYIIIEIENKSLLVNALKYLDIQKQDLALIWTSHGILNINSKAINEDRKQLSGRSVSTTTKRWQETTVVITVLHLIWMVTKATKAK